MRGGRSVVRHHVHQAREFALGGFVDDRGRRLLLLLRRRRRRRFAVRLPGDVSAKHPPLPLLAEPARLGRVRLRVERLDARAEHRPDRRREQGLAPVRPVVNRRGVEKRKRRRFLLLQIQERLEKSEAVGRHGEERVARLAFRLVVRVERRADVSARRRRRRRRRVRRRGIVGRRRRQSHGGETQAERGTESVHTPPRQHSRGAFHARESRRAGEERARGRHVRRRAHRSHGG